MDTPSSRRHRSHHLRHDEHDPLLEGDGPRRMGRRDLGDARFQLPIGEAGEGRPRRFRIIPSQTSGR